MTDPSHIPGTDEWNAALADRQAAREQAREGAGYMTRTQVEALIDEKITAALGAGGPGPTGPTLPDIKVAGGGAWPGRVEAYAPFGVYTVETDESAYADIWGGSRYGKLVLGKLTADVTRVDITAIKQSGSMFMAVGAVIVKNDGTLQYLTEAQAGSSADGVEVDLAVREGTDTAPNALAQDVWFGVFVGNAGAAHTGGDFQLYFDPTPSGAF